MTWVQLWLLNLSGQKVFPQQKGAAVQRDRCYRGQCWHLADATRTRAADK